jgi:hypothetical protein
METFTAAREFVAHPRYAEDRRAALAALDLATIDAPLVDLVSDFAALPHAFTLQCCYGHFLWAPGQDPHTLAAIPPDQPEPFRYRIAYLALCLEVSPRGRALREALAVIAATEPERIQFGSADWFWDRWPNSYALQVEPHAQQQRDVAIVDRAEALQLEATRSRVFTTLEGLLAAERAALAVD